MKTPKRPLPLTSFYIIRFVMPSSPNRIIIDDREAATEIVDCLENEHGYSISVQRLALGDYLIEPDTVVERKTVRDFCTALASGRLYRQAYALAVYRENPLLLIEGESFEAEKTNVSLEAIKGTFITLAQTFRLPYLRSRNERDSAWYLSRLAYQRQRIGKNKGVLNGPPAKRTHLQKRYVLQSLPGVGTGLAEALLDHFDSVEAVMGASTEQLTEVAGIGVKKAEDIRTVLRESRGIYKCT